MEYERSVFTLIDILGFSKFVEGRSADEVRVILEIHRTATKPDQAISDLMDDNGDTRYLSTRLQSVYSVD